MRIAPLLATLTAGKPLPYTAPGKGDEEQGYGIALPATCHSRLLLLMGSTDIINDFFYGTSRFYFLRRKGASRIHHILVT
jgi:hypothetical protein